MEASPSSSSPNSPPPQVSIGTQTPSLTTPPKEVKSLLATLGENRRPVPEYTDYIEHNPQEMGSAHETEEDRDPRSLHTASNHPQENRPPPPPEENYRQ